MRPMFDPVPLYPRWQQGRAPAAPRSLRILRRSTSFWERIGCAASTPAGRRSWQIPWWPAPARGPATCWISSATGCPWSPCEARSFGPGSTVPNRLFSQDQFWDGRSPSLEDQALGPVQNPIEMGHTLPGMIATLDKVQGYKEQFKKTFGTGVTKEGVAQAIASFERTLLCGNSAFDKFEAGDKKALSASAQRGLTLFRGKKANCVACHTGFNFTDEGYHNLGVGMDKKDPDLGRFKVTKKESDKGAFKTPTLRNIAASAQIGR